MKKYGKISAVRGGVAGLAIAAALLSGGAAFAQEDAPAPSEEARAAQPSVGEIVVTAQKRDERLQDVPLAVQVVGAQAVENAQIARVEDVVKLSPTVTFSSRRGFDQTSIRIRGIGTQELGAGVEPSVSVVVDGVVMARGGAGFDELPDVERIEVLNGPQGTLFGKNSSIGAISIVTKKPSDTLEAEARVRGTTDKDYSAAFSISSPIADDLAIRVSGFGRGFDGNVKNVVTGDNVNGVNAFGVRTKLLYTGVDNLEVLLSADYSNQSTSCCARVTRANRLSPSVSGNRPGTPDIIGDYVDIRGGNPAYPNPNTGLTSGSIQDILGPQVTIGHLNDSIAQNWNPIQDSVNKGASLQFDLELGDFTLTSLSAYRFWDSTNSWDNDLTGLPFQRRQLHLRHSEWGSQELRLTSPRNDFYDFILGLYFYKANTRSSELSDRVVLDTGQSQLFLVEANSSYTNYAAFGNLNLRPVENLTLFGGFRMLSDTAKATAGWTYCQGNGAQAGGPLVGGNPTPAGDFDCSTPKATGSKTDTRFVYRLGAQYALSNSVNAYASYGTGYKGRGFSLEFGLDPNRLISGEEPIRGETSKQFEVGIKGALSRNFYFDLAYYDLRLNGLQQALRDPITISNRLGSVNEVRSNGFQASFIADPIPGMTLSANYAYTNARYTDFANANCYLGQTAAQGCINNVRDRSGDALEASPKHNLVLSGRHEFQTAGARPFIQGNYRWQSSANYSENGDPEGVQEAYSTVDLSAGLISADENLTLTLFVKNLFNKFYVTGVDFNGPDVGGVVLQYLPRDYKRYGGVALDLKF